MFYCRFQFQQNVKVGEKIPERFNKEIDYLVNFTCQTSNFYGLPKVHKSDIIAKAIEEQNSEYIKIHEPEDLTLCPIVTGPNCPTKRLSTLIINPIAYGGEGIFIPHHHSISCHSETT